MNICYVTRSFANRGGTESYIVNMATGLARLGHRVHIVSTTGRRQHDGEDREPRATVHEFRLAPDAFRGSWRLEKKLPLYLWRYAHAVSDVLSELVPAHAIDLVETTEWAADACAYLRKRTVPVLVRLHGHSTFKDSFDRGSFKAGLKENLVWRMRRKQLAQCDVITAVSRSYCELARRMWSVERDDIHVLPIGIDLGLFSPGSEARAEQTVVFAGRLEDSKGIGVLAAAIPQVLQHFPAAQFRLLGRDFTRADGRLWSEYLSAIFPDNLSYLGALPDDRVVEQYRLASVCVVPSLYEPGGMVALEAMACGCPVIASRVGGLQENIEDGRTGLLATVGDPTELAQAIIRVLGDRALRESLSANGIAHVRARFAIEQMVARSAAIYSDAIAGFRAQRH
jgi:glycosyltransferase involved in cell wall biosynthesis